jgi:putative phosphoesterase
MKYIFFSDIHGNNHSFHAFIKKLSDQIDQYKLIFLGDFIGYYYGANEIIDYCRKNNIYCILGNHDQYFLDVLDGKRDIENLIMKYGYSYEVAINTISYENINFLRKLDWNNTLISHNKKVYICHGSPLNNLEGRIYPDTDLSVFEMAVKDFDYVVTGHTHHKMDRRYGSKIFLNPGSLGQQRDGKGCSYMILDLEKDTYDFHVVEYQITDLEKQIDIFDAGRAGLKDVLRRKS